jgi:hypothetical protein
MAGPYTPSRGKFAGREFASHRQYRNALARDQGFKSSDAKRRAASKVVRSRAGYDTLKPAEKDAHGRALEALNEMRRTGRNLRQAARAVGTTVENVLKFASGGLTRGPRGRYTPKSFDRLLRPLEVMTRQGKVKIDVRDSRSASKIGSHYNALKRFVNTGDVSELQKFRRAVVRSNKLGVRQASDLDLDQLMLQARAGELSFEHIYQRVT